jgi:AraC-like DNA-binding protein
MRFYIKYMVSQRCKLMVKSELDKLGIKHFAPELGTVEVLEEIGDDLRLRLASGLLESGLELLDDKKAILIEKVKNAIVEMVHHSDEFPLSKYSSHLSERLGYDYTYLSNVFTAVKGITIQQYIILNRIERVKELMLYDEMNLTEISRKLHYSSVAHLSNQFKKITGMTPSFYRHLKEKRTANLESF